MRILLAANASYVPPRGGATRSNLVWMDHLAEAGHECRIVAGALADDGGRRRQMQEEGIRPEADRAEPGVQITRRGAIEIRSVEDPARRVQVLRERIAAFHPDWVLVSSEDLAHGLLREAHHAAPGCVVYLAHTPQFFPFGKESWNPDTRSTALVGESAAVVAVGHAMAGYIERAIGRRPAVVHPPIYGPGPYPNRANFDAGLVTMINPCAVKGISIFQEVAARFPERGFGVLPGWGTTGDDRRALERLPNVHWLPNCQDIDEFLAQTRILLMPSLWFEGFGLIVMEAMLRGIPVIASDSGGLVEAKRGTGYVIPVRGIERYEAEFDERAMPRPVVPANDVEPWTRALDELLGDRAAYERESERSREMALAFAGGLNEGGLEQLLRSIAPAERPGGGADAQPGIETLSPERRALLLERLRQKRKGAG